MKCNLCSEEKILIKRSHIIPNFMYNGLFNEKHFIAPVDLAEQKVKKFRSTGFYDSNILCKECDNEIIGKLESYSRIILRGGKGRPESYPRIERKINQLNQKYLHLINIDYTKFKLFLLSIIWRTSISKQKIFESINLGAHEKIIGEMIYNNNPGKSSDYPVGLFVLNENENSPTKMIAAPKKVENGEDLSYLFLINGLVINYKIQGTGDTKFYNHIKIEEDKTMDIYIFDEKSSQEFIDSYLNQKLRYK